MLFQFIISTLSAAVSQLDFARGTGTTFVDQFSGAIGNGWASGWITKSSSTALSTASTGIISTSPLYVGGWNYLHAGLRTPGGLTDSGQLAYNRKLNASAISLTRGITYSFYFRPDNSISDGASYFMFSRIAGTGGPAPGTDANDTWAITSSSTKTWKLQNGADSLDTGMTIAAGRTYFFTINSDPTSNTYTVSISDGTTLYNSGSLNYRCATGVEGEYIGFGVKDTTPSTANDFYFSLDSLSVTQGCQPITLDFTNGTGTAFVDQFSGVIGNGWASEWITKSSSTALSTASTGVISTSPLSVGGSNYLHAGLRTPGGLSDSGQLAYNRKLNASAISLTQGITYSFYFRPDNNISEGVSYFMFSRIAGTGGPAPGTDANDTWAITSSSTKTWKLQNGASTLDTGMTITAGLTYFFTINSDPTSNTYTVSISDGTTLYNSGSLNYRCATGVEGEYIGFGVKDTTPSTANDFYFSLDSLTVIPAPQFSPPVLVNLTYSDLTTIRSDIQNKGANSKHMAAYQQLITEADLALTAIPVSVMDKTLVAASGNKHDFFSIGYYSWPNPDTATGLPYIRLDGQRNPDAISDKYDKGHYETTIRNVKTLSLAWFYSGDEKYAAKAAELLRVWFLNSATKMNPHYQYSAAQPGVNDGTPGGIIEGVMLSQMVDYVQLLTLSTSWTPEDNYRLQNWFSDLTSWLTESNAGKTECAATNNHGLWYVAQVLTYCLYTNERTPVPSMLQTAKEQIADQIASDGTLPAELRRTQSLWYSRYALQAFMAISRCGDLLGEDISHYKDADGIGIENAFALVAPYLDGSPEWPWPRLASELSYPTSIELVRWAVRVYDKPIYTTVWDYLDPANNNLLDGKLPSPKDRIIWLLALNPSELQ